VTPRTGPGRRRLRPLAAAVSLLGLAPVILAADASAIVAWQDNVTNTTSDGGRLAAWMVVVKAADEWRQPLDRDDALYFGADVAGNACLSYPRLDDLTAGPRLALLHKFGLGAYAPLVRLEAAVAGIAARQSMRSGGNGRVSLGWSRRFTEALQLGLGGEWVRTDTHASTFSTTSTGLAAEATYDFTDVWRGKIRLGWRTGDVVSYYRAVWTYWGWQPAGYYGDSGSYGYGSGGRLVDTFDEPYLAYRLQAHTWSVSAALSPALGPDTSLVFSCEFSQTENADSRYLNQVVSAGVVHRF